MNIVLVNKNYVIPTITNCETEREGVNLFYSVVLDRSSKYISNVYMIVTQNEQFVKSYVFDDTSNQFIITDSNEKKIFCKPFGTQITINDVQYHSNFCDINSSNKNNVANVDNNSCLSFNTNKNAKSTNILKNNNVNTENHHSNIAKSFLSNTSNTSNTTNNYLKKQLNFRKQKKKNKR